MQNEQKNKLEKCAALHCFPPFEVLLALRAHLKKNVSLRSIAAPNHPCVSGEVPFKKITLMAFLHHQSAGSEKTEKMCERGCNKATTVPGKPEMPPLLCKHLHQLSLCVSCLFVSILGGIISCLVMNNRLSYSVFKPNYTFSISRGDY